MKNAVLLSALVLMCEANLPGANVGVGKSSDGEADKKPGSSQAEDLVYLDDGVLYVASCNNGEIHTTAISKVGQTILNFAVAKNRLLILRGGGGTEGVEMRIPSNGLAGVAVTVLEVSQLVDLQEGGPIALKGDTLAYVAKKNGQSSLKILDLKSGVTSLLVAKRGNILAPAWAPNGGGIAYYYDAETKGAGVCVNLLDPSSKRDQQVAGSSQPTGFGGLELREPPVWSGDSSSLYIYAMYKDGGLGTYLVRVGADAAPMWMSYGLCTTLDQNRGIAYVVKGGTYAVSVSPPQAEPSLVAEGAWWPRISPSGKLLAYVKSDALYVRDLSEGTERRIVNSWKGSGKMSAWLIRGDDGR